MGAFVSWMSKYTVVFGCLWKNLCSSKSF